MLPKRSGQVVLDSRLSLTLRLAGVGPPVLQGTFLDSLGSQNQLGLNSCSF